MSGSFPANNAASARNYTTIKKDGVAVESKCTTIDFLGELTAVNSVGNREVQVQVALPQYITEPADPQPQDAWIFHDVVRSLGGGLAAIGLLLGPGVSHYYLKFRTLENTTVGVELT